MGAGLSAKLGNNPFFDKVAKYYPLWEI